MSLVSTPAVDTYNAEIPVLSIGEPVHEEADSSLDRAIPQAEIRKESQFVDTQPLEYQVINEVCISR